MPGLFEEATRAVVLTETADWWASCPARVVSVSDDGSTITAQPLVRRVYVADQQSTARPQVPNVPLVLPSAGQGQLVLKPAVGDLVLLVCASRSLDEVRANGWSEGAPRDARRFSLSDAFAIPFQAATPPTIHVRMVDGKLALGAEGVELVDIVYQMLLAMQGAVAGPFPVPALNTVGATYAPLLATIKE